MIVFTVTREDVSWRLERDDDLVCYFPTKKEALTAASRFVANLARRGEEARVDVGRKGKTGSNSFHSEHGFERQDE